MVAEPVEYRNQRGKSKWQPRTYDGERLWNRLSNSTVLVGGFIEEDWRKTWMSDENLRNSDEPVLFASKKRARRIARRKEVSDARVEMDETFKEVVTTVPKVVES